MVMPVLIIPDVEKEGMVFCMMPQSLCAFQIHNVEKKDFAVLCSIYVPDFEYLSKAFSVEATSIYLLDV